MARRADKRAQEGHDLAIGRTIPDPAAGLDLRNRLIEELRIRIVKHASFTAQIREALLRKP